MREIIKGGFHKGFAINNRSRQTSFAANYNTLKLGKAESFQHSKYKGECIVRNAGPYKNANAMGWVSVMIKYLL